MVWTLERRGDQGTDVIRTKRGTGQEGEMGSSKYKGEDGRDRRTFVT